MPAGFLIFSIKVRGCHTVENYYFSPKVHELGIILFYNFMILHVLLNVSRTSL